MSGGEGVGAATEDALLSPEATSATAGGYSRSTLYRMSRDGTFPAPVVLSRTKKGKPQRIAWRLGDVLAWCARRTAEARAEQAAIDAAKGGASVKRGGAA